MSVLVMYVLGAAMIIALLGMFWYFVRSISIMGRHNILLGIACLVLSPVSQVVFYAVKEDDMNDSDKKTFVGLAVSILAIAMIAAIATVYPPPPM